MNRDLPWISAGPSGLPRRWPPRWHGAGLGGDKVSGSAKAATVEAQDSSIQEILRDFRGAVSGAESSATYESPLLLVRRLLDD